MEPDDGNALFTLAVPLFNHEAFVGRTVDSAIGQTYGAWELCVSDNCSTDGSVAQVRFRADARLRIKVNSTNVGFSPNLDLAVSSGSAPWVILLSSDDVMEPFALEAYSRVIASLSEQEAARTVLSSPTSMIDEQDKEVSARYFPQAVLDEGREDPHLSELVGLPVLRIPARRALKWAMSTMRNPMPFLSTCYPRALWEATGGYLGSRTQNPDKWFHWRLLASAGELIVVDYNLFRYRVHRSNQAKARANASTLKHLIDEYLTVLEADHDMLETAELTRVDLARAFIAEDVAKRAIVFAATHQSRTARRYLRFGASVMGLERWKEPMWWAARGTVITSPISGPLLRGRVRRATDGSPFHSDL